MAGDPRPKNNFGSCGCGCGIEGVYRTKTWRDQTRCVRLCKCLRCRGSRNRTRGLDRQSKAAKALAVPQVGAMRPGEESCWPGTVRVEVKSGAQCRPAETAYRKAEAQAENARAIGDNRPLVVIIDGQSHGEHYGPIVMFRLKQIESVVTGLAEQYGLI